MVDDSQRSAQFVGGGKYELLAPAGEGAMGTVYLARHVVLERIVAVKLLHDSVTSRPGAHERFLREAQAASALRHKNMVWALDFGVDPEAGLFFVMEYIEGKNLSEIMAEEGAFAPARALMIVAQILGGLAEAHDLGIVHRDIKAANVMLVPMVDDDGDEREHVKVFDFGIASIQDIGIDDIAGTPEYMAPEQIKGEDVDPRADLYSVGVLLYTLLTGSLPFSRATPRETMQAHLEDVPLPLSATGRTVSKELEQVVAKALSKAPSKRFPTARKFRAALLALREFTERLEPTQPPPPPLPEPAPIEVKVEVAASLAPIAEPPKPVRASTFATPVSASLEQLAPPLPPAPPASIPPVAVALGTTSTPAPPPPREALAKPSPMSQRQREILMTRADNITKLIKQLASNTPDVEASAVIDNDGLMIASALAKDVDDDAVAAMSAALLGIGERIVRELGRGNFEMVMTRGSAGYVILVRCGKDAVLSVLTSASAKIGLIFLDVKRAANDLAKLLG